MYASAINARQKVPSLCRYDSSPGITERYPKSGYLELALLAASGTQIDLIHDFAHNINLHVGISPSLPYQARYRNLVNDINLELSCTHLNVTHALL